MRRKNTRKVLGKESIKRAKSHATFTYNQNKTLAELNHVSARTQPLVYHPNKPCRILLPDYFNVPKFADPSLFDPPTDPKEATIQKYRATQTIKAKVKDLEVLAEGMRRAKNIKQQSRYYFISGVILHNNGMHAEAIASLQKFLKIVLFLRDQKSIQLALNAIGGCYMAQGATETAREYHRKQGQMERADRFPCHLNTGLCYEIEQDYHSAQKEYQDAQALANLGTDDKRKLLTQQVLTRTQLKINNTFVTSAPSPSPVRDKSLLSDRSSGKKEGRMGQAIQAAESGMGEYLQHMRNSFLQEDEND